jgi:hypothetical protein
MVTDLALDRDELQIVRLGVLMLAQAARAKGLADETQRVLLVLDKTEAAIKKLPDKEL